MPDTLDTKKEIEEYLKDGLDSIVMERKAEAKADKTAKAAEKFIEKAKKDEKAADEKASEKAKKPKKEIDVAKAEEKARKSVEKEAEKAKKAAEKAAEKEAEKAKKAAEKEAKKAVGKACSDTDNAERKIFDDEMRIRIKEMFPDLNSKKTTKKIEELWKVKQDSIY